jgi:peptidyl-tRNA hydrolase, PTH1 family
LGTTVKERREILSLEMSVKGDDGARTMDPAAKAIPTKPTHHRTHLRPKTNAKEDGQQRQQTALVTPPPTPMSTPRVVPLLICSLGNPGSGYANTLHSAGHTVLNSLREQLGAPLFQKDRGLGGGLVSKINSTDGLEDWTLWQSPSYMNESGKGVRSAWTSWSRNFADGECKLVVIYDELEKALGTVTLRTNPGASAKGHNGLKSIMSLMGNTPFARIGVGIGRPVSRESDDVARYVLKKMTLPEKEKIEGAVGEVIAKLKQVERG